MASTDVARWRRVLTPSWASPDTPSGDEMGTLAGSPSVSPDRAVQVGGWGPAGEGVSSVSCLSCWRVPVLDLWPQSVLVWFVCVVSVCLSVFPGYQCLWLPVWDNDAKSRPRGLPAAQFLGPQLICDLVCDLACLLPSPQSLSDVRFRHHVQDSCLY